MAAATGAAAAATAGVPAGLIADMIAGITMPLSRSIAWPAPNWLAMLDRSPMMPLLPVLAGIVANDGSPMIGKVPAAGSSPIGAEIGTSPGAGRAPRGVSPGSVNVAGVVSPGAVRPATLADGLVSAAFGDGGVSAGFVNCVSVSAVDGVTPS